MSLPSRKATLLDLPPELMGLILPDRKRLSYRERHQWLAIARSDESYYARREQYEAETAALSLLRAVSQTCTSLRSFALPLLWNEVEVQTIDELGRLCEYFEAEPYIASYVNSFKFSWSMNGDFDKCDAYGAEHGTLLDMAFIDRGELWYATGVEYGKISPTELQNRLRSFLHDDVEYVEPGVYPESEAAERKSGKRLPPSLYPHRGRKIAAAGPDGEGEDKRIKSSVDFNSCVTRLVALLAPSLVNVGWNSPIAHMPSGALEALDSVSNLRWLMYSFSLQTRKLRSIVTHQLCALASKVQILYFHFIDCHAGKVLVAQSIDEVLSEDDFPSFRAPYALQPLDEPFAHNGALQYITACRAVVAAAKGAKLMRLYLNYNCVQEPFAMRQLVPAWVKFGPCIDPGIREVRSDWDKPHFRHLRWFCAARWFPGLLAHASRWLSNPYATPRSDPHLTPFEVQSILAHLEESNFDDGTGRIVSEPYLRWCQEDAELARQVSDAWNAGLERGLGDAWCECAKCGPIADQA